MWRPPRAVIGRAELGPGAVGQVVIAAREVPGPTPT